MFLSFFAIYFPTKIRENRGINGIFLQKDEFVRRVAVLMPDAVDFISIGGVKLAAFNVIATKLDGCGAYFCEERNPKLLEWRKQRT